MGVDDRGYMKAREPKVGDVYGDISRPDGRPDRQYKLTGIEGDVADAEIIGALPLESTARGRPSGWGIGVGTKFKVPLRLLGNANNPLIKEA